MLIKVTNKGAVDDGLLYVEFPTGVRYLDSSSRPKNQGRVQFNSTGVAISDINLAQKKDVKFMLSLGVQSNAGDSLLFTTYFHDYDKQCTDTERLEVLRLK